MIDFTEIDDGDDWELFARDFFSALGFVIELDPSRGADGGKDFIISEQVSGKLRTHKFRWLVSCKHNATSGKSVGPKEEPDIRERLEQHGCEGFIGFYSTLSSTGLSDRLDALKQSAHIEDFAIYDGKKITGYFYDTGFSRLASRYFPKSYENMRPIQQIVDKHVSLECEICGCDWVKEIMLKPQMGIVLSVFPMGGNGHREIEDVCVVCKGDCDQQYQNSLHAKGKMSNWEDIEDLCNPLGFLKNCLTYMNMLHSDEYKISDQAHDNQKTIYIAIAQRVLREISDEEKERIAELSLFEGF
ncbi:MAG: restriction endonuclease [Alphaproteobacteria bacterium]